jgi:hypothetical protein
MRHTRLGGLLLSLIALSLASYGGNNHNHGLNVNIDRDEPITSCDQLHVTSQDDREIVRAQDQLTLPQTSSTVGVEASRNGGIYVYG